MAAAAAFCLLVDRSKWSPTPAARPTPTPPHPTPPPPTTAAARLASSPRLEYK